jgi:hypothetical protein
MTRPDEWRPENSPRRPADPRDRQDVGHRGDEAPDFGQDYGNVPEIDRPAPDRPAPDRPTPDRPAPDRPAPDRPAACGASSGETWGQGV